MISHELVRNSPEFHMLSSRFLYYPETLLISRKMLKESTMHAACVITPKPILSLYIEDDIATLGWI